MRIAEIEDNWQAIQSNPGDVDALDSLYRVAHGLAGSGSTFGFPQISSAAVSVEHILLEGIENDALEPEAGDAEVAGLLQTLQSVTRDTESATSETVFTPADTGSAAEKRIFLVDDNLSRADALKSEVGQFGYQVDVYASLGAASEGFDSKSPSVIVANIELLEQTPWRGSAAPAEAHLFPVPVVFIASEESHDHRIAAVRSGGKGFLHRPFDPSKLVHILDSLTVDASTLEPYRVLIVEDDNDQSAQYAAVLEGAGMRVTITSDPRTLFDDLIDFDAELILMDLYLPDCTGLELAAALRQRESVTGVPIVFLSTEARIERQIEAIRQGGDEFLTKPIAPDLLATAVRSRVHRARIVRSHMMRDSLTEALNHVAVMEQLDREISRTSRTGNPLSFALIDLDHFKAINDVYGHGAGDRVIKALSRLLHQRLRRTDVIGRYGGEEFAIVLTGTDAATAKPILDSIRNDFAAREFEQDGQVFSVTVSGGISEILPDSTAQEMRDAADQALYVAKDQGRNRILIASEI